MHNNSAQRSAFSFKQWSNSSSTWGAFASPLIKLFIAGVFLCTSMATAQVGIHGELYIAPDAQIALHGPTHFVQGNITTDPLSPSPLWIAPTASIVASSPAAYSEAPIHSLGHDDLLFATGKEGSYRHFWEAHSLTNLVDVKVLSKPSHPNGFESLPRAEALNCIIV